MENIRPIRTEKDYDWALREIEALFDTQPKPGTPDGDRFDVLASLIESYEDKHWAIDVPDPIEAIRTVLEQNGWNQARLAEVLGSRSRASEIMNRRRPLTLAMIQKISAELRVPAEVLIQPYHLAG